MVRALVAAHYRAGSLAEGVHKGEDVELVEGAVVDVGADGVAEGGVPSASEFLLVEEEVLGCGDYPGVLGAAGDGAETYPGEIGVVAETFPVAAASGDTAQGTGHGAEGNVDAFAAVLVT